MDNNPKEIDLSHRDYRADGIKGEPFFGPGWPFGVSVLISIIAGTMVYNSAPITHVVGVVIGGALASIFPKLFE